MVIFASRCRKNSIAALDTHILKLLKENGIENVPKITPGTKKQYHRLETEFLRMADEAMMTPADYDLMVWVKYANKKGNEQND